MDICFYPLFPNAKDVTDYDVEGKIAKVFKVGDAKTDLIVISKEWFNAPYKEKESE